MREQKDARRLYFASDWRRCLSGHDLRLWFVFIWKSLGEPAFVFYSATLCVLLL